MIPLRDNIRSRRTPLVNYSLIAITSVAFLLQLSGGDDGSMHLVERFGMIPKRVFDPETPILLESIRVHPVFGPVRVSEPAASAAVPVWLTLLTCIFLHGGWLHFLGNMWFLHIFGDNVEDALGRPGYLAFYLGTGVAASLAHLIANADSTVPTIGASGAIAGIMGAYFVLYPRAMVLTLLPIFFFFYVIVVPAPLFLGIWFLLQFFQGTLSVTDTQTGGVAWWAHIGGFVVGLATVLALRATGHLERRELSLIRPRGRLR